MTQIEIRLINNLMQGISIQNELRIKYIKLLKLQYLNFNVPNNTEIICLLITSKNRRLWEL